MKKCFLIIFSATLLSSCKKDNKCWIIVDCLGNDLSGYCGSEREVQEFCRANNPPGCTWGYRPE